MLYVFLIKVPFPFTVLVFTYTAEIYNSQICGVRKDENSEWEWNFYQKHIYHERNNTTNDASESD